MKQPDNFSWARPGPVVLGPAALGVQALLGLLILFFPGVILRNAGLVLVCAALGASWAVAVWAYWKRDRGRDLAVVLVFGLMTRVLFILSPPVLSADLYRYMWDGRMVRAGLNPYSHPPSMEGTESFRDAHYDKMNNTGVKTVYPPLAQAVFAATGSVSDTPRAFKTAAALFDIGVAFLIVLALRRRKEPAGRVVIWSASPLVLIEFAGHGHGDALGIFFLLAALLLMESRREKSAVLALTFGVLSKFYPILFAPLLWTRLKNKKLIWILPGLVLLAYLPFIGAGGDLVSGLIRYADAWTFNASVFDLLYDMTGGPTSAKLIIGGVLILAVILMASAGTDLFFAGSILGLLWILGSPTVLPWYFAWALAFLPFSRSPALFWLAFILPFSHLSSIRHLNGGSFDAIGAFRALEYLPLIPLILGEIALRLWRKKSRRSFAPSP